MSLTKFRGMGGERPSGAGAHPHTTPSVAERMRTRLSSQAGYTLIELLLSAALSVIVFGAVLTALETSQHVQARDQEWALSIEEARASLARMAREIRQAYSVRSDTHSEIVFNATIGGKSYGISYNCTEKQTGTEFNQCVRRAVEFKEGKAPSNAEIASAHAMPIIKNVLNGTKADEKDNVFEEYSPNAIAPDLVTVKLVVPSSGTLKLANAATYKHKVVLENGAYIRDMALGG